MRILVFLHGTAIMHAGAAGRSREERVRQSRERSDASLHDYGNYLPTEGAVAAVSSWAAEGAEVMYLSSHTNAEEVAADAAVLRAHGFPPGEIFFRENGENYGDVVGRVLPDVLIEDDCESIGQDEMTYPQLSDDLRRRIVSIVVPEFGGLAHLPTTVAGLMNVRATCEGSFTLRLPLAAAVELFTPEGERRWAGPSWNPVYAVPAGAGDDSASGTVFTTDAGNTKAIWIVLERRDDRITYARVLPGRLAGTVGVRCSQGDSPGETEVTVTYDVTSLGPEGAEFVRAFEARYDDFLREWREAIVASILN